MKKQECVAMLLAGGQGSRLNCLTAEIAKPGLSFGGKYRIIDFSLSNCSNSMIETVGVLTQYRPFLLNRYMGVGTAWDFDNDFGGLHTLPPYMREKEGTWYKGTANAIYQNINFIDSYDPEYVLILSGDHIYKMDYSKMLDNHKAKNADVSIAVIGVTMEEASRFGIMSCDSDDRIIDFEEKPKHPKSTLASMGIYIFNWKTLRKSLIEDENDPTSGNDFGGNIIPTLMKTHNIFAYRFSGYWKDVGTIDSYYDASMELLDEVPPIDLYEEHFKISSNTPILPAQFVGKKAVVKNSIISNGCTIKGKVENSILGYGVTIEEGAIVENSILLPDGTVKSGSMVDTSILGEGVVISRNSFLGYNKDVNDRKITVVENRFVTEEGCKVDAGTELKS